VDNYSLSSSRQNHIHHAPRMKQRKYPISLGLVHVPFGVYIADHAHEQRKSDTSVFPTNPICLYRWCAIFTEFDGDVFIYLTQHFPFVLDHSSLLGFIVSAPVGAALLLIFAPPEILLLSLPMNATFDHITLVFFGSARNASVSRLFRHNDIVMVNSIHKIPPSKKLVYPALIAHVRAHRRRNP